MSDFPDDLMKQLGLPDTYKEDREAEKRTNFEESSVRAVLKQLGWTNAQVNQHKNELETGFGWDWFNDLNLINVRVGSTREFRFDFFDLLRKPNDHPITQAMLEFINDDPAPVCLIFYVYNQGRWIATNLETRDDSSLHVVANDIVFNVLTFEKFFVQRWGLIPPDME